MSDEAEAVAELRYGRARLIAADVDPRLVFFVAPDADVAGCYRRIVEQIEQGSLPTPRRLGFVSPGRGTGKTLTCLNVASAAADHRQVVVVDLHLDHPAVCRAFGLEPEPGVVEISASRWDQVELQLIADGFAILGAGHTAEDRRDQIEIWQAEPLKRFLDELQTTADWVFIDGISVGECETDDAELEAFLALVGGVVLVTRPGDLAGGSYDAALERLGTIHTVGVVVNGAPD